MSLREGTTSKIDFYANNNFSGSRISMRDVNGNRSIEMFSTDGSSNKPGELHSETQAMIVSSWILTQIFQILVKAGL